MAEEKKKQIVLIVERTAILLLIIALAIIMGWSSKQIKIRREAYVKLGAKEEAAKAVPSQTNDADFYFNEGINLARAGRFEEAVTALNKAVELNPSNYSAISNLGLVYKNMFLEKKDPELLNKAIELYNKAVSINPNFADAHNNLGDAYFNQGKYAEAEKEFKECLRLDPMNLNSYNNLGVALIMQDKKEEAVKYWKKSLEINPDQPRTQEYIGRNE